MKIILLALSLVLSANVFSATEKECSQMFIRHLQACDLANRACEGYPECIENRKHCNFELNTEEACKNYEKCIEDFRVKRVQSLGLAADKTQELLSKEGCSYYWYSNMGLKGCSFEKKSFSKKRINLLECPGFVMTGLDHFSQDYKHNCAGRDIIYKTEGKNCEDRISKLIKECPNYKPDKRKKLKKGCTFSKSLPALEQTNSSGSRKSGKGENQHSPSDGAEESSSKIEKI